jgi:hypothetical protein
MRSIATTAVIADVEAAARTEVAQK